VRPLPNNGAASTTMALAGLTLVEAGLGLSLFSGRLRRRARG
jgi:hypothetical protein